MLRTSTVRAVAVVLALALALVSCGKKRDAGRRDAGVAATGSAGAGSAGSAGAAGKPDPAKLAIELDNQCVAGDLEACRSLGVAYSEGIGVAADPRKATALFAQACNGGNCVGLQPHAALALAEGLGIDALPGAGDGALPEGVRRNYALGCTNLGLMLRDGRGVAADLRARRDRAREGVRARRAVRLHERRPPRSAARREGGRAAPQEDDRALPEGVRRRRAVGCRYVGLAYLDGKGLPRATNAAAVWFDRACRGDDPAGCRLLGMMLADGVGVKADRPARDRVAPARLHAQGRGRLQRARRKLGVDACQRAAQAAQRQTVVAASGRARQRPARRQAAAAVVAG